MPSFRRFLTRTGQLLQQERGAVERLCGFGQQLSSHPHLQDLFLSAMRQALAWHCLRDRRLAELCFEAQCQPWRWRFWSDLEQLPEISPQMHSPQFQASDQRRWRRALQGALNDLGWGRDRRRQGLGPLIPLEHGFCSPEGRLPRVLRRQGQRCFTPLYASLSLLSWPLGPHETIQNI